MSNLDSCECSCETMLDDQDLSKEIGNMFQKPEMRNSLNTMLGSMMGIFGKLQQQTGQELSHQKIEECKVSYEDIMLDINTRIVPHLLSKVKSDVLNTSVNILNTSKEYASLSMMYNICNYLVKEGHDETQINLYRDSVISSVVWTHLYNPLLFYEKPSEESAKIVSDTMTNYSVATVRGSLGSLNLNELMEKSFGNIQSE